VTTAATGADASHAVLAIDAGQTAIKTRLRHGGTIRDGAYPGIRTHEELLPQLVAVVRAELHGADLPVTVAAGVSGLTSTTTDAAALGALLSGSGVVRALLAHDSTTSFLGALGEARGAVIAAGTGVVTLAVGASAIARVDGWGSLIGDAGSGYWIGREALDAVMRDLDGRGPATSLRRAAESRWPDLTEAYIALQSARDRVRTIASFAEVVAAHADGGDAVAGAVTRRAAAELALSVHTALRRVHAPDDGTLSVCAIGGVFRSAPLRAAFEEQLAGADLEVRLVAPAGQGIDGALALATLPDRHPLATAVSVSP